jgi:hypothetical protein
MIHALGYSHNDFDALRPGRLCRGRERWIESWTFDEPPEGIHRLVISGACFTDDSASDALRGIQHAGVDRAALIEALFPNQLFLAFTEDGHPADIPDEAEGIEAYEGYRAGGQVSVGLVRWHCRVQGEESLRRLLGDEPGDEKILGLVAIEESADDTALMESVFVLVGMSTLDSPPARFNPGGLIQVTDEARAVLVLHRDKHGPVFGVYSREPVEAKASLQSLCAEGETLLVPFAIPPMLARWDRALSELRAIWSEETPFPVPQAPVPSWDPDRTRHRGRRGRQTSQNPPLQQDVEVHTEE